MQADISKAAGLFIDVKGRLLLSKDKGSTKWQCLGGKIVILLMRNKVLIICNLPLVALWPPITMTWLFPKVFSVCEGVVNDFYKIRTSQFWKIVFREIF